MLNRNRRWVRVPRFPFVPERPQYRPAGVVAPVAQVALSTFDGLTGVASQLHELAFRPLQPDRTHVGLFALLHDRWIAQAMKRLETDPRWVTLNEDRTSGKVATLEFLEARMRLIGEVAPRPLWYQLKWLITDVRYEAHSTVRGLLVAAGARTRSNIWFFTHEGHWQCPDCEMSGECGSTDGHACTAAIVDVTDLPEMERPQRCGYCNTTLVLP